MQGYFGALTIVILIGMVVTRVLLMKRKGLEALQFGKMDKTDFLIPPFALFYFYLVFANTFSLPTVSKQEITSSDAIRWIGVIFCLAGLGLLFWSLVSFGKS